MMLARPSTGSMPTLLQEDRCRQECIRKQDIRVCHHSAHLRVHSFQLSIMKDLSKIHGKHRQFLVGGH